MSSSRKSSTKSHHDRSVPDGSSLQHVDVVPKVEFSAGSIDPEEVNAYWVGRGEVKPPVPGLWVPSPFKANPVAGCPSRGCPNGLAAIRRFCRVPELVEFRLPEAGEVALSPPEGNFTCYEAYLMQCHLWRNDPMMKSRALMSKRCVDVKRDAEIILTKRLCRGCAKQKSAAMKACRESKKPTCDVVDEFMLFSTKRPFSLLRWLITAPQGTRGYLISDKDSRALEEEAKAQSHMLVSQEV
ncbi:hypothetical protein Bca52824_053993 [Brassica carinata]|uniref:Uncharacterized protein n=1 Tax=Brassica carinata TaxID=52824 RepID=A0A8X7R4Z9_BRACI|nr:hypothetical protein Bca52824_053993 [Brassica carinata]